MVVMIGLVGAGQWAAEGHAPALASCPGVRFAGVWARSSDSARALATRYSVPAYDRYEELLEHCAAVAFAVPPAAQPDLAVHAARHGKSLLLEKPPAGDRAGAEDMTIEVNNSGVVSQLALTWRYTVAVRHFLATAVRRTRPMGGSGRIVSGSMTNGRFATPWRRERGVLMDLGPHLIDLLDAALGRIVDVRAHGDPQGWVGLMLEHEGGHFSEASLCATAGLDQHQASVEVFGPGGAAAVDCAAAVGPDAFETMYREFAEAVEHRRPHELDVNRGLYLQRVLAAAEDDLVAGH
jgi:predicted dehydrogenase